MTRDAEIRGPALKEFRGFKGLRFWGLGFTGLGV